MINGFFSQNIKEKNDEILFACYLNSISCNIDQSLFRLKPKIFKFLNLIRIYNDNLDTFNNQ